MSTRPFVELLRSFYGERLGAPIGDVVFSFDEEYGDRSHWDYAPAVFTVRILSADGDTLKELDNSDAADMLNELSDHRAAGGAPEAGGPLSGHRAWD